MKQPNLDYEHGRIGSLFGQVFLPTLLGMVFNALITIVDGVFVGRGVGPDGIAAVNVIVPIFMVSTGLGLMFGIGASVSAGIAIASKDKGKANRILSSAYLFSTLIMVVIVSGALLMPEAYSRALGASEVLMPHAKSYLVYLSLGLIPLMWQSIGMMVIRLDGSPKYAMMCNVIPSVLNIFLDWWMIFPLGMGVRGAALATSISSIIGGLMAVIYFRWSYILKFTGKLEGFWILIGKQVKTGLSAFITELAMSVMIFTGNHVFMQAFGDSGVAAYAIACYLFPLIFMINNAVAQSAQPIISINFGCRNYERVRSALKISLKVALLCGCIASFFIALGAKSIVSLFISPDCEAGRLAVSGLPIFSIAGIFFALNIAFIGYYQSIEKGIKALVLTLLRGVIFLVPLFFLMARIFPTWGMWGAVPLSEALTLIVILVTFFTRKRLIFS